MPVGDAGTPITELPSSSKLNPRIALRRLSPKLGNFVTFCPIAVSFSHFLLTLVCNEISQSLVKFTKVKKEGWPSGYGVWLKSLSKDFPDFKVGGLSHRETCRGSNPLPFIWSS
jgi:hypothetical protein